MLTIFYNYIYFSISASARQIMTHEIVYRGIFLHLCCTCKNCYREKKSKSTHNKSFNHVFIDSISSCLNSFVSTVLRVADYPAFLGTDRIRFVKSVVRACRHFSFSICADGREKRKKEKEILCKASADYFHEGRGTVL